MSMETELKTYLRAHAGLVALVGQRIYPYGKAPQEVAKPYCVFSKKGNKRVRSHQGYSGLSEVAIEVNCYAETGLQAEAVMEQVTEAVESWPGVNQRAQSAKQDDEQDLTFEDEAELHHRWAEFSIMYG